MAWWRWAVFASAAVLAFLAAAAAIPFLAGRNNGLSTVSVTTSSTTANAPDRYAAIPAWAPKYTPQNDTHPPVLHSDQWQQPIPMPGPINTAGAEDSPFITPDGN